MHPMSSVDNTFVNDDQLRRSMVDNLDDFGDQMFLNEDQPISPQANVIGDSQVSEEVRDSVCFL